MYKFTQADKQTPRWGTLIKQDRKRLKETQTQYGYRFGVTATAISLWESGQRDPSSAIAWYLYKRLERKSAK